MAANADGKEVRPANDAYTGMLAVSLTALLVGCGVLYLDFSRYSSQTAPKVDYSFREAPLPEQGQAKKVDDPQPPPADDPKDKDKGGGGFDRFR